MATTYDGINYFPIAVNFMEENAMEVIEAKYGMKGLAIVLKLLCKIYKEGYYIPWGEEQCLIFANKTGKEADAEEVQGIIEIMIEKGMIDRGSYAEHKVLTSEAIQKVWIEATKRRKRNWTAMPYLLIKPKETCNEEKTVCTQNVEQDAGSDAKNACNTEQSKVKQSKTKANGTAGASPRCRFCFFGFRLSRSIPPEFQFVFGDTVLCSLLHDFFPQNRINIIVDFFRIKVFVLEVDVMFIAPVLNDDLAVQLHRFAVHFAACEHVRAILQRLNSGFSTLELYVDLFHDKFLHVFIFGFRAFPSTSVSIIHHSRRFVKRFLFIKNIFVYLHKTQAYDLCILS